MSWEACAALSLASPDTEEERVFPERAPSTTRLAPDTALLVVDHFDLTMVDLAAVGACLRVQPLTRLAAMDLVASRPDVRAHAMNLRGQVALETELGLPESPQPTVTPGTTLLVRQYVTYKDIRWFLVSYESDGDGVLP